MIEWTTAVAPKLRVFVHHIMSYHLNSLKWLYKGDYYGLDYWVVQEDIRSLDNSSYEL